MALPIHFLTGQQTDDLTGMGRTTRYDRITRGLFVAPVKLGKRSLWPAHEVQAINEAILRGATDDELRALVAGLHEARKTTGSEAA